jgi:TldD protein
MTTRITVDLVDRLKPEVRDLLRDAGRRLPHLRYADARLEVAEGKFSTAENGESKASGDDYGFSAGVRVLAGDRAVAPGWVGLTLGTADLDDLPRWLREALERAYRRAVVNAELKASARGKFGPLGDSLTDTRLHPIQAREDTVQAAYAIDPRTLPLSDMVSFATDVSARVAAVAPAVKHNYVSTLTQLTRELFASTEGALIDQAFALTQGLVMVVGVVGEVSQELYDVVGHQRGWEILTGGVQEPPLVQPPFADFALALARESVELAAAPALPTRDRPEVVVTDPHYNTLVSHEIVGHPVELDRALKMETAYAGRSWLLPGYGHYVYDHEGTPARRVVHIDRGVLTGFMNSRQTAAIFGGAPNGHFKATDAALVPLIRMSNTVFAGGDRDPAEIIAEVDRGWYLVGHRIPSIAESRENFRISARKVYEIRDGRLGRLYRDGGIMADTREYLMNVDAVGSDFALYPIPNCGKGQPMQTKKLGNGGPTMRSRARLAGG